MRYLKSLGFYLNWSKVCLLKLVKSPIGARKTFQIYEDAQELDKSNKKYNNSYKDIRYMLFFWRKGRRMMW